MVKKSVCLYHVYHMWRSLCLSTPHTYAHIETSYCDSLFPWVPLLLYIGRTATASSSSSVYLHQIRHCLKKSQIYKCLNVCFWPVTMIYQTSSWVLLEFSSLFGAFGVFLPRLLIINREAESICHMSSKAHFFYPCLFFSLCWTLQLHEANYTKNYL